jgi:hypothetical protein
MDTSVAVNVPVDITLNPLDAILVVECKENEMLSTSKSRMIGI